MVNVDATAVCIRKGFSRVQRHTEAEFSLSPAPLATRLDLLAGGTEERPSAGPTNLCSVVDAWKCRERQHTRSELLRPVVRATRAPESGAQRATSSSSNYERIIAHYSRLLSGGLENALPAPTPA